MENQELVSPSRQCSSTPDGYGQGFLRTERCDNTGAFSDLSTSDFLPIPSSQMSTEGTALLQSYWHH